MMNDYELLDSGNGKKLERLGELKLIRPASICIWRPLQPQSLWESADAEYDPKRGWIEKRKIPAAWQIKIASLTLELRLQSNGQVGLFPEHALPLGEVDKLAPGAAAAASALNLFAYTGMATCYCAMRGLKVTHVDLAKKTLEWANRNLEVNSAANGSVRMICDDALKFIEREIKRKKYYNIVIVDPPSFSRISKAKHWKLLDHLADLAAKCVELLDVNSGKFLLIFSCHDPLVSAQMLANVLGDAAPRTALVKAAETGLSEAQSSRILPAGCMGIVRSQESG